MTTVLGIVSEILMEARRQLQQLWLRYPYWPALPLMAWAAFMATRGLLRVDHVVLVVVVVALTYIGPRTRALLAACAGFIAVGWLYDAMRFVQNVGLSPERILLCDLYHFELRLFGFDLGAQRVTLHDYFFVHHNLVADFFFSVPYGTFIALSLGYAIYLFFVDARACSRYAWIFFVANVAGFITYHLIPAAPPWYFHTHGCAIDLSTHAYEGAALARVDAALGIPYFHSFYGRSSDVFGAIPSLHVAYPLLLVWETLRRHGWFARAMALTYAIWMSLAAIYLDHHWITDIVVGWIYAVVAIIVMYRLMPDPSPAQAQTPVQPQGDTVD